MSENQESTQDRPFTMVAFGGGSMVGGAITLAIFLTSYYMLAGKVPATDEMMPRLVLFFRWMTLPVFFIFINILAVSLDRIGSGAADGRTEEIGRSLEIKLRVLRSSMEQIVMFAFAQLALLTWLDKGSLHLIPTFAVIWFVGRILFLAGYLKGGGYRGAGNSMTSHPTIITVLYLCYLLTASLF